MTTDNRTNEPTPEQIEAAVHAAWVKSREFRGVGGQAEFAPPWEFQQVIRAALVAAQGAAPEPSSGVDEDKLAEVMARVSHRAIDTGTNPRVECIDSAEVARAVIASRAEWLKGQGR